MSIVRNKVKSSNRLRAPTKHLASTKQPSLRFELEKAPGTIAPLNHVLETLEQRCFAIERALLKAAVACGADAQTPAGD